MKVARGEQQLSPGQSQDDRQHQDEYPHQRQDQHHPVRVARFDQHEDGQEQKRAQQVAHDEEGHNLTGGPDNRQQGFTEGLIEGLSRREAEQALLSFRELLEKAGIRALDEETGKSNDAEDDGEEQHAD